MREIHGDIRITSDPRNSLEKVIRRYSDEDSPTVIQVYNQGDLTEAQLITLVHTLEINGFARKDLYDLPFSFAKRILGSEDIHGNN